MTAVPELVHHCYPFYLISFLAEDAAVSGQGTGIAAHVNDARRRHGSHSVEQGLVAAFPRRVHDDDVRADAGALILSRYDFFGLTHVESDVVHLVEGGVAAGVIDGFFDDFHAVNLLGFLRQEEGDRSNAAVKIPDDFLSFQAGVLESLGIENFRLHRVHLEEGEHEIRMTYTPEGLWEGSAVSLACVLLFFLTGIWEKRHPRWFAGKKRSREEALTEEEIFDKNEQEYGGDRKNEDSVFRESGEDGGGDFRAPQ